MSTTSHASGNRQRRESSAGWVQPPSPKEVVEGTRTAIADHAVSSVALCFGLGFGAGLLIGLSLSQAYAGSQHERSIAERCGRQIMETVSRLMPGSLGGRT